MSVPVPYEKILMFLKYNITTSLDKCCLLHLVPRACSTCEGQPVTLLLLHSALAWMRLLLPSCHGTVVLPQKVQS